MRELRGFARGIIPNVAPRSEDEVAALAAAVATYARGSRTANLPEAIEDGLHALLYELGSDGVHELAAAECTSRRITFHGVVIWVTEQTFGPLEAVFDCGGADHPVTRFTVRAGDGRINRRNSPRFPQSARALQRIIATRPTVDEDWEHIVVHELT